MVVAQRAAAQNEAQFSDYTRLKSFYNPAVSGTDGMLNVAAAYASLSGSTTHRKHSMWELICQFISSIPTMERE